MKHFTLLLLLLATLMWGCKKENEKNQTEEDLSIATDTNEPHPEFNIEKSDPSAIYLADKIMESIGGKKAWNETKFISWSVGDQTYSWNKEQDVVRIDLADKTQSFILDLTNRQIQAVAANNSISDKDSLATYLQKIEDMWTQNYRLIALPFELKGDGVTLYYIGEDVTLTELDAHKIQLAFEEENPPYLYDLWVDPNTNLIVQWAYYPDHSHTEPLFTEGWSNYRPYNNLLLAETIGNKSISNISVSDTVDTALFTID